MPRPHREIPSQRLPVSRTQAPETTAKKPRSLWWGMLITVVGWLLLAYPIVLLGLVSTVLATGPLDGKVTAAGVALGILGYLGTLAMLAFPPVLGFAVMARRRTPWIIAIVTGVLTLAAFLYLTVEWLVPLA
ncbi:hypothetical protein [Arthrobacter sp. H35-D1]|uniref:hypothetical protein n=1 Tax=Arthrobacter sp. H35-D1 TaxID=3046202 RepID=UPI0024BBAEE0|nr:hypothetical protein [Arthrobacter sp. H35-D1]MDJ0312532.1 hypothetical protein [Arthrobacter sp. H35-D1]